MPYFYVIQVKLHGAPITVFRNCLSVDDHALFSMKPWRRGGLMVSALDSGSGDPGSSPGWGHCVVFLGKTLYSHSASLHPGVQMGTSKCAGGNPVMD